MKKIVLGLQRVSFFKFIFICCLFVLSPFSFALAHDFLDLSKYINFKPQVIKISNSEKWIAIVGDSVATGAATSPSIKATFSNLSGKVANIFINPKIEVPEADLKNVPHSQEFSLGSSLPPPSRVYFSNDEYNLAKEKGEDRLFELGGSARGSVALDTLQYSFGYFFGRALGVLPSDIVYVAQDGQRVDSIFNQFNRIKMTDQSTLPPLILLSFTANDLCNEDIFNEEAQKRIAEYEAEIRKQFNLVFQTSQPHKNGTHIIVLAPLNVSRVLTNEGILNQEIEFGLGRKVQCRSLREGSFEGVEKIARDKLCGMCNSVLKTSPQDVSRLNKISEIHEGFVKVWSQLIREWSGDTADIPKGFHFDFIEETSKIEFEEGDVGNDCFHPSILAHEKLARLLLKQYAN